jgi:20S proteasome alpha/beta subunit
MTLIVSVISADGIVIAGDSLASLHRQINVSKPSEITCPKCEHTHVVQANFQGNVRQSTYAHTEKVFPFLEKYGIGVFGAGLIGNFSVNFLIRSFEDYVKPRIAKGRLYINGVSDLARELGVNQHSLLIKEIERHNQSLDDFPDNHIFVGFQVVGYDLKQPKIIEVLLGKEVNMNVFENLTCYASGNTKIVEMIREHYKKEIGTEPLYKIFSLQEAIDYVEFLIRTTIDYQRFSPEIPNVGGSIDIALVTPFDDFRWIRQKPLGELLQGGTP